MSLWFVFLPLHTGARVRTGGLFELASIHTVLQDLYAHFNTVFHDIPGPKKHQTPGFSMTQVMHFNDFTGAIFACIPLKQNWKQHLMTWKLLVAIQLTVNVLNLNIQGGSKKCKLLSQYNSLLFFEPPCIQLNICLTCTSTCCFNPNTFHGKVGTLRLICGALKTLTYLLKIWGLLLPIFRNFLQFSRIKALFCDFPGLICYI